MRRLAALLLLALVAAAAPAAPARRLDRDLGQGLAYARIRSVPADLPPAPTKLGAIVLDLRYAGADVSGPGALGSWLQVRATRHTPVFVLVNADTAPALLDYLANSPSLPGLVTLGPDIDHYEPDVPLSVDPAAERAAYDALDRGATLASLLTDQPDKPRHDEAVIAREHSTPTTGVDDNDSLPGDDEEDAAAAPPAPPPLIDGTLQRAVHLHRALLALKRL